MPEHKGKHPKGEHMMTDKEMKKEMKKKTMPKHK